MKVCVYKDVLIFTCVCKVHMKEFFVGLLELLQMFVCIKVNLDQLYAVYYCMVSWRSKDLLLGK